MRGRGWRWVVLAATGIPSVVAASSLAHPPTGNPGAWFGADAYPAEALRRNEQGRVVATLKVDAAGRVVSCVVTGSSGSAALDAATCRTAMADRRVRPAMDARGLAIPAAMPLAVRWMLPTDAPPERPAAQRPDTPPRREHRAWFWRLGEAHHLLPVLALAWAAVSRRVRRRLGWGVFDDDGSEVLGDRLSPRRRSPRLDRVTRAAVFTVPIVALAALLAWLDP